MCGIVGLVEFKCQLEEELIEKMADAISHRGPDNFGFYLDHNADYSVGLGHRRLSILDLTGSGHQPMTFEHLTMVYNGEVYNFQEIKEELINHGYEFNSGSDSEVIIKGFHFFGLRLLERLNGMFAIALYDNNNNKLLLVRDRAGVKPIYYSFDDSRLIFSSELKSFHKYPNFTPRIDQKALESYLNLGYIPSDECIFDNCQKVMPGQYVEIDLKTQLLSTTTYWSVSDCYAQTQIDPGEEKAIEKVEELLVSASNYRMVSDVPVGVFLSGGYDSSLLTAMLNRSRSEKLKTFTIGFGESEYNEANDAKVIADYLGTEHTELYCTEENCLEIIDDLSSIWDEPFADNSSIPTYLVSKLAKSKVKVVLSADGGDELFGGYEKYNTALKMKKAFRFIPFKKTAAELIYIISESKKINISSNSLEHRLKRVSDSLSAKNDYELLSAINCVFSKKELEKILVCEVSPASNKTKDIKALKSDSVNSMLAVDYSTWQADDILQKVDRATMANSIEGREPFLDYRLIEYISRLPAKYKISDGKNKYLLKKISEKYLPKDIMERPKKGFNIPVEKWMKETLLDKYSLFFSENYIESQGIFRFCEVGELIHKLNLGNRHASYKLWTILVFQLWYHKWMNSDDE